MLKHRLREGNLYDQRIEVAELKEDGVGTGDHPDLGGALADAPRDGGTDQRARESGSPFGRFGARLLDARRGLPGARIRGGELGFEGLELLLADQLLRCELARAGDPRLELAGPGSRFCRGGLGHADARLRLAELIAKAGLIEANQRLTSLHLLTAPDVDLHDRRRDLGADGDLVLRADCAADALTQGKGSFAGLNGLDRRSSVSAGAGRLTVSASTANQESGGEKSRCGKRSEKV